MLKEHYDSFNLPSFTYTKNLLVALIFNNPDVSPRRILQLYGMKLALNTISIRELRTMFGAYNKHSWYRLIADMKDATITQQPMSSNLFKVIKDCLIEFKAITKEMLH